VAAGGMTAGKTRHCKAHVHVAGNRLLEGWLLNCLRAESPIHNRAWDLDISSSRLYVELESAFHGALLLISKKEII